MGLRSFLARAIARDLTTLDLASREGQMLGGILQGGGEPPRRNVANHLAMYGQHPTVHSVASRIAYDIGSTTWRVLAPTRRGADGQRVRDLAVLHKAGAERAAYITRAVAGGALEEVVDHPLIQLLAAPNAMMSGLEAMEATELSRTLVGESFWVMFRRPLAPPHNVPTGFLPCPAHWILGTATASHPFYRVSFRGWQGDIPASDVLVFKRIDPSNPLGRGTGVIRALSDELETDEMASKHAGSFFRNSARPDLVISPKDGNVRQEEVDRLREQWESNLQGFWRAWRSYFMTRAVEVKEIQPVDMRRGRYVETRQFNQDQIFVAFGVPSDLFIIKSGVTRATLVGHRAVYNENVLVPALEHYRSVLQQKLMPMYDERLVVDYIAPQVDDPAQQLAWAEAFPEFVQANEARGHMGLPPLLGTAGQAFATGRARSKKIHKNDDDPASDEDEPVATRLAGRHERAYIRAQEASWRALSSGANETALTSAIGASDADAAINAFGGESAIRAAYAGTLTAQAVPVFLAGAELASRSLPPGTVRREPIAIDLQAINPEATRWAEARAARLVTGVSREAREAIRLLIVAANEQGIAPRDVARRIVEGDYIGLLPRQATALSRLRAELVRGGVAAETITRRVARFAAASLRKRAMLIARTELIEAVNAGQQALWQQAKVRGILPAGTKRVWLVTLDDALEEDCAALDGVEVEIDEPFPGGVMHPPLHPQCRCALGIVSVPQRGGNR